MIFFLRTIMKGFVGYVYPILCNAIMYFLGNQHYN